MPVLKHVKLKTLNAKLQRVFPICYLALFYKINDSTFTFVYVLFNEKLPSEKITFHCFRREHPMKHTSGAAPALKQIRVIVLCLYELAYLAIYKIFSHNSIAFQAHTNVVGISRLIQLSKSVALTF